VVCRRSTCSAACASPVAAKKPEAQAPLPKVSRADPRRPPGIQDCWPSARLLWPPPIAAKVPDAVLEAPPETVVEVP